MVTHLSSEGIVEKKSSQIPTLRSENFVGVLTECFSPHQGKSEALSRNIRKVFTNFKVGIIELSFPFMQEPTEKQLTLNKSSYSLAGIADDGGQSRVSCVVGNSKAIQTNGDNGHQLFNKKRPNLTSSTNCNPVNTDSRNCWAGLCTN